MKAVLMQHVLPYRWLSHSLPSAFFKGTFCTRQNKTVLLPTTAAAVGVIVLVPSAVDVPGLPAFHCWAPLQL